MDVLSLRNALPERIETARLVLRAPDRRDVPALARLADNPKIHAMSARVPSPYGEAEAIAFVEDFARRDTEKLYVVTLKSGPVIGVMGLSLAKDTPPRLAFWLGEPFWGKGFASEAGRALVAAALATGRCPAITARVRSENAASRAVLEKLGFVETGETIADCGPHRGVPVTAYRYGVRDWGHVRSA